MQPEVKGITYAELGISADQVQQWVDLDSYAVLLYWQFTLMAYCKHASHVAT